MLRSIGCSPRDMDSTPSTDNCLLHLMPSSGLQKHQAHNWCTDINSGKTPIRGVKGFKKKKKEKCQHRKQYLKLKDGKLGARGKWDPKLP